LAYTNDIYGRLLQIADLAGAPDTYPHDRYGQIKRIADQVGAVGIYSGDQCSQLRRIADGVGAPNTYPGDVYGQVLRIADTGAPGAFPNDIYGHLSRIVANGGIGGGGGPGLPAPVLTITSGSSVLTPTFSFVWPDVLAVDDVVTLQQDTASGFPSPVVYTHTITPTDVANGSFGFGNSALVNGTYYFRVKAARGGSDITSWSNTASITITDTAATITSANTDSIPGNQALAHALTADKTVAWSITGGADAAQFSVSGSSLRWVANGVQNFAAPADADANNIYVVQVTATTTAGTTTNQTISVTVTNPASGLLRSDGSYILRPDGFRVLRSN